MVQKLSEFREQLCSNGRHLKTHPASPSLEHKHMCLGNSYIPLSVSNFHPPVPARGLGPSCPTCGLGTSVRKAFTTQKSSMAFPGPGSALPVLGSPPRRGCPGTKRGSRAPAPQLGGSEPCKCGEVYKINSYLSGQWVKSEPSFNELCG